MAQLQSSGGMRCSARKETAVPQDVPSAFFSYCRADSEFALKLAEDLKAAGANVWIDQLDIEPGVPWDRAIQEALTKCQRLLVILSPVSVDSENVNDEISFALGKQKRVIPILYRDCDVPLRLVRLQHIDFRSDYKKGLGTLLAVLRVEQSTDPKELRMPPPEQDGLRDHSPHHPEPAKITPPRSRIGLKAATIVCLLLAGVGIFYWISSRSTMKGGGAQTQNTRFILPAELDPKYAAAYRKALGGDTQSMEEIGSAYRNGYGAPKDYVQAFKWYRLAADGGDRQAMNIVGAMYEEGEGVEKDRQKAVAWYRKAAALGEMNAPKNLQRLGESTQ